MSFQREKTAFFKELKTNQFMVLATSAQNRTTARTVSCCILNEHIYFQTAVHCLKFRQLMENPQVALCFDNVQIEGIAADKGHPLEQQNKEICQLYQACYESSFRKYSASAEERILEVQITRAVRWLYKDGMPFRQILDFTKKTARKEPYDVNALKAYE